MAGLQAAPSIAFHWLLFHSLQHYIFRHRGKQATVIKLSQPLNALYGECELKQNYVVNLLSSCCLKGP
jgi:hypothetical protein